MVHSQVYKRNPQQYIFTLCWEVIYVMMECISNISESVIISIMKDTSIFPTFWKLPLSPSSEIDHYFHQFGNCCCFMETVTVSEALKIYCILIQLKLNLLAMKASNFMFCPKDGDNKFL